MFTATSGTNNPDLFLRYVVNIFVLMGISIPISFVAMQPCQTVLREETIKQSLPLRRRPSQLINELYLPFLQSPDFGGAIPPRRGNVFSKPSAEQNEVLAMLRRENEGE